MYIGVYKFPSSFKNENYSKTRTYVTNIFNPVECPVECRKWYRVQEMKCQKKYSYKWKYIVN